MIQLTGTVIIHLENGEVVKKIINENTTRTNAKKRACQFLVKKLTEKFPEAIKIDTNNITAVKGSKCQNRLYRNNPNHRNNHRRR